MSKINVYSSSASNAIKVFDASSTGVKPNNAILVTTGTEPSNAIQINVGEKNWSSIAVNFGGEEPGPGPSLPPYTIRLKYEQGTTPTFSKGTGVLVDAEQNIWDLTYENTYWNTLLQNHISLLEVIDANTTDVTRMNSMFNNCSSLTSVTLFDTSNVSGMGSIFSKCTSLTTVPLFDISKLTSMASIFSKCTSLTSVPLFNTSNVTNMNNAFAECSALTSIPLFDTSNVSSMDNMFNSCYNVQSGALALYQQASTQNTPPIYHYNTFKDCGSNTQTGAAELAQIPTNWGGTYNPLPPPDDDD